MEIALGIDTGGTYTDAVLVEYETNRILASAKALTTKHDLAIGIREAMRQVLQAHPAEVQLVSLSTTLATNAIVEGNGAPVCALLIGYQELFGDRKDLARELGTEHYAFIAGGHSVTGEEAAPLDITAAVRAIREHAPHVAAFAISGYFGTRNPGHELEVKRLVKELTGLPVTCGHELTRNLDALRRATTVTLNGRLIPLLCDLIDAVEQSMAEQGIHAPLMVVKGDGSLMEASLARERPIETILSGPAASVVGAQHLAGGDEAIVVDMGGTTTDIAIISRGSPRLSPEGAKVGRWRTMVEAIDVHTVGLGGDSRVWLDEGRDLRVGPRRVVPICLLAAQYPHVVEELQRQAQRPKAEPTDGEFLLLQRANVRWSEHGLPFEEDLLAVLRQGPCSMTQVDKIMVHPELYARDFNHLERQGIVIRAGFTPTDASHVTGAYAIWDREAAQLAAQLLARRAGFAVEGLCRRVFALVAERVAAEVVAKLLEDEGLNNHHDVLEDPLVVRALRPSAQANLQCALTVRPSLVAIGAPVRTYFPRVAQLLHGTLRIPDHPEVANALGAVVGSVVCRIHTAIIPQDEGAFYRAHLPDAVRDFETLGEALAYAEERGRELAIAGARRAGAEDIRVQVEQRNHSAPVAEGWGQDLLLQTDVDVTAIGRPRLARRG